MHSFNLKCFSFFSHIRWNEEENKFSPNGFYVKTLEFAPPQLIGFKLFRHWPLLKLFNLIGASKFVAKDNAKVYASSAAMGAIIIPSATPQNFVEAGRLMERVWLTATKLGLSIQPTTGVLFLMQNILAEETKNFSSDQVNMLKEAYQEVQELLSLTDGTVAMLFRIGRGGLPTARAARFPLEAFLDEPFMQSERKLPQVARDRKVLIDHILKDLSRLRGNPSFLNQYAIEENIAFFEAIKSVPRYLWWLITRAPRIDRARLLELTDLPFPRWDREMHLKLIEVESRDFPGLVAPLVNRLSELIFEKDIKPFVAMNLGCGGMEAERQVIRKLLEKKFERQAIFIGIDVSPVAREIATENLREVEPFIDIHHIEKLNQNLLDELMRNEKNRHIVILAKNDIFELPQLFSQGSFDVIYHTFFKHHLNHEQKIKIDSIVTALARRGLEYDGYKSWPVIIPQTLTGWSHPVFLNAELFSNFRFFTRNEIVEKNNQKKKLSFFNRIGTYLLEYH